MSKLFENPSAGRPEIQRPKMQPDSETKEKTRAEIIKELSRTQAMLWQFLNESFLLRDFGVTEVLEAWMAKHRETFDTVFVHGRKAFKDGSNLNSINRIRISTAEELRALYRKNLLIRHEKRGRTVSYELNSDLL